MDSKWLTTKWALGLLLLHVPLGYAMHQSRALATFHAAITVLFGIYKAITGKSETEVACVAAYIAGAEVLWRMSNANIPYESGKYAVAAVLVIFGLRFARKRVAWPIAFALLLLPAIIPTFLALDFSLARQYVSFNISGPISLAICVWFFAGRSFSPESLGWIGVSFLMPVVGVAAITLFTTYTADNIAFRTSSNFATSGGFGPNQVSAVLALGFLMSFFILFVWPNRDRLFLAVIFTLLPVFLMQSAMTFSRTGVYLAFGSVTVGSMYLLNTRRARFGLLTGATALAILVIVFILPALESFTSGMLSARFQEMDTSNRITIMQHEIETWDRNPGFGVGLGMARFDRKDFDDSASHTEYSRLLAEHGMLGIAALCLLLFFLARNVLEKRQISALNMAFTVALTTYFAGFLFASGMRLVIPSLVIGLSFAIIGPVRILSDQDDWQQAVKRSNA